MHACFREGWVSRKGLCLSNLFPPLPCGRKNHWPAPSLIPEDTQAGRQTGMGEEERERSRPQGVAKEPASGVCVCAYACAH